MPVIVLIILCIIICASLGWVSLVPIVAGFVLGIIAALWKASNSVQGTGRRKGGRNSKTGKYNNKRTS